MGRKRRYILPASPGLRRHRTPCGSTPTTTTTTRFTSTPLPSTPASPVGTLTIGCGRTPTRRSWSELGHAPRPGLAEATCNIELVVPLAGGRGEHHHPVRWAR